MRVFIYQTREEAPFEGLFEPIGSFKKVILSNHATQIELFNRHSGSPITDLLPEGSIDPQDETVYDIPPNDERLFFIPLDMKDTFMKLLKSLFRKTKWAADKTTPKPSKDDIGLVGDNHLSPFYDTLETQAVLQPSQDNDTTPAVQQLKEDNDMSKKQELEDLFNNITGQDNEIDAVLVCTHDDNKTRIAYTSTPKTGHRKVDTDSFAVQVQHFVSMLKMTNKVNEDIGALKTAEFLYSSGIVHITHLPQFGEYTFLVFASSTEEGIELLALHRKRNLDQILELLGAIFG